MHQPQPKLFVVSAPSGAGKTTLVRHLLETFDIFAFSVSATTRKARSYEKEGVDYYFLNPETFERYIQEGRFLEWEEVYKGKYYGTLKSEVSRIFDEDKIPLFDVDVEGGVSIKEYYGARAVSIFIQPPQIEVLLERLRKRGTDKEEDIRRRYAKAKAELAYADRFDYIVVNDVLDDAKTAITEIIHKNL